MENPHSDFDRVLFFEHARKSAEAAYVKNPHDADNLTRWGGALLELSQYQSGNEFIKLVKESILRLEAALAVNPRKHDAMWCLGNAHTSHAFHTPDHNTAKIYFAKATECFRQAVDEEPGNELYQKSLDLSSKAPELHLELYRQLGSQQASMGGASASNVKDGELPNSIAQSNKLKLFSAPQGSKEAKSPHQPSSNHEILFNSKVRGRQNQTDQSARADLAHLMETVGKSWRTISEYPESASEEDGELIFDTIVGRIDLSNLQLMNNEDLVELAELGSGAFGTVYHGQWRGTDVAIKRINKNCFTGRQDRLILETLKEAGILANLLHPNIVSLYGFVLDELGSIFAIVTELVADGSLRNILLREDKYLDHYTRLIIAKSAASGMEYLHLKKVVHFDLKCDNLLVDLKDPSSPICKVADFGLSKVKQETLVSGGARGTIPWMAPELFKEDISKVSEKIDVYSFGIVMWEILTGEVPYAGLSQGQIIGGIFRDTLRPPVPTSCDPRWRRLMEECWATDPQQRPAFTQIARRLHSMLVASHSEALK